MGMNQIRLLIEETRKRYPIEACGALFGELSGGEVRIKKIVIFRNTLESTLRFQIDPEDFLKALFEAEMEGLQHIGFFHSHSASPYPSMVDIKYMKLWPETIWLIISSINYEVAAYRMINGDLQEAYIDIEMK
jgi:proteasome lid subunit RPN8/RPN11